MSKMISNPYLKKVKTYIHLELSCNRCKTFLLNYQKIGKGNLRILHVKRILDASFNLFDLEKELLCPQCKNRLGVYDAKLNGYRMQRSAASQKLIF